MAKPSNQLCNLSMALISLPGACKIAKSKPILPMLIYLLPLLPKIFQRVVLNQTKKFLSLNKILYGYQSSFRKNHSIDTCLSFLNDKIFKGFNVLNWPPKSIRYYHP